MLKFRRTHNSVFDTFGQLPNCVTCQIRDISCAQFEKKNMKTRNMEHKGLYGKAEKIDFIEIKFPSIFKPPKTRKPISERRKHSVHPFPKLGSGNGVYVYENRYFRYEGEWRNGQKHGQGKLFMSDGTYYSGQFTNGEIQGHGFKFFANSKNEYMGYFIKGEMHGKGKMIYSDGGVYEGEWQRNKKHGYGIMHRSGPETYEGSYLKGMRDGYGHMLYRNGDKYEGHWKNDTRMGHGVLRFADGTIYDGEFFDDKFNGQGLIRHCSGVMFEGEWVNGFPVHMASKIVIIQEEVPEKKVKRKSSRLKRVEESDSKSQMTIYQGTAFKIKVECKNENDEVVRDDGRELLLMAGFRYDPKSENGNVETSEDEDVKKRLIETPFGYSVLPYPITDQIIFESEESADVEDLSDLHQEAPDNISDTELREEENHNAGADNQNQKDGQKQHIVEEEDIDQCKDNHDDQNQNYEDDHHKEVITEEENQNIHLEHQKDTTDEEYRNLTTDNEDVYQTNINEDNENPVTKSILPPPVGTRRTHKGVCQWEELHLSPAPPGYLPFKETETKDLCSTPSFSKRRSSKNGGRTSVSGKDMFDKFRQQKKKQREEKYARTGEYVLMVYDVTNPPYLNKTLSPAFLRLNLKQPVVEKKRDIRSKLYGRNQRRSKVRKFFVRIKKPRKKTNQKSLKSKIKSESSFKMEHN